jgi:hypothetical protein
MLRWLSGMTLTLWLLAPAPAAAYVDAPFSVRELAIQAQTVVLGVPLDPVKPERFRVLEVLRGPGLRPGDTLALDLSLHPLETFTEGLPPARKPKLRRLAQALLFLGPGLGGDPPRYRPLPSGLRFWDEDAKVLAPEQLANPGPYVLVVRAGADWGALLRRARADVAVVNRVLFLKGLARTGPRNRGLLDWVERHRSEFSNGAPSASPRQPAGWYTLETDVFRWVLESGVPEDCWAAVKLHAELNGGAPPELRTFPFSNPPGRALLLRVALDGQALGGDRVRALTLLADGNTLWPPTPEGPSRVQPLEGKEQADLLDRLTPLLKAKETPLRAAAARALHFLSATEPPAPERLRIGTALPALVAAYRAEAPGPARDELADAVCAVGGPTHWQELTGNPPGLLACVRDLGLRDQDRQAYFWLSMRPGGRAVHEPPTLTLERLDKNGKVLEKQQRPLPAANLATPWDGSTFLLVQFSVEKFKPGTWRVSVHGTAARGADRVKWTAEPKTFVLAEPKKESPPRGGGGIMYDKAW